MESTNRSRSGRLLALTVLSYLVSFGGCGYHLVGRGGFLPEYVHTIGIPTFQNHTSKVALEQKLTNAVVSEMARRGNFDIVARESNVDAVLAGTITGFSAVPVGFTPNGNSNRIQVVVSAQVALLDARARKVIYQNDSFTFRDDYDLDVGGGSQAQNAEGYFDREPEAVDEVAKDFAESVAIAILEGF
ncbi:MAG: LPS assembly lipoprotein LptE [Acidobacteriota bacterium]